jgi:two-component system phosphate regulon response regulator PhoB
MPSILIVDDEAAIREMVRFALSVEGFECREAANADEARMHIQEQIPDLVLLDWVMPGQSGLALTKSLRRDPRSRGLPIIMLSARGENTDKVSALDAGADDYVTKPFSPSELIARIRAVLRRTGTGASSAGAVEADLVIDDLELSPGSRRVRAAGAEVELGPTEFGLLHFFMSHPERVYSRRELIDHVWPPNTYVDERTVDVHIRRLRKALEPSGHATLVQTVRGAGYRLSRNRRSPDGR